jgi:COX assembly protein 2
MHTPLDPHLHTPECNKIIAQLIKCHADRSKFVQLFGVCNDLDTQMRKCTKAERLARTEIHRKSANERNAKIAAKLTKDKAEGRDWREEVKSKLGDN